MTHEINRHSALDFILAGEATFTVRHRLTGNHLTYRVRKANDDKPDSPWFVSLLFGPDNETNYRYLGCLWGKVPSLKYRHGKKSQINDSAMCVKVFSQVIRGLVGNCLHENFEIWHEGKCGRCGRKLTVPESIESGYGPECIRIINKAGGFKNAPQLRIAI